MSNIRSTKILKIVSQSDQITRFAALTFSFYTFVTSQALLPCHLPSKQPVSLCTLLWAQLGWFYPLIWCLWHGSVTVISILVSSSAINWLPLVMFYMQCLSSLLLLSIWKPSVNTTHQLLCFICNMDVSFLMPFSCLVHLDKWIVDIPSFKHLISDEGVQVILM